MFLHIGNARIVFKRDVIGIFHMNLRDNLINKQFLESASARDFNRNSDLKRYKSFIVTGSDVLVSPVVPATLARRNIT
jgi:hypothetical protein